MFQLAGALFKSSYRCLLIFQMSCFSSKFLKLNLHFPILRLYFRKFQIFLLRTKKKWLATSIWAMLWWYLKFFVLENIKFHWPRNSWKLILGSWGGEKLMQGNWCREKDEASFKKREERKNKAQKHYQKSQMLMAGKLLSGKYKLLYQPSLLIFSYGWYKKPSHFHPHYTTNLLKNSNEWW